MSCSPFDLRDYFLRELPDQDRRQVEAHVRNCPSCREELDRLGLTQAALFSLGDEEIPQRVAFVSDQIFEPSPWRRGWSALWTSGPRLGFASAAMLSAALVVFALTVGRPVGPASQPVPQTVTVAQASMSNAEIEARIDAAVARAVAASEQQQTERTRALVAELESARQKLMLAAEEYDLNVKRQGSYQAAAYRSGPGEGEPR
ncbi:MAG: anti-sigma factor family protein [Bryobacteraceae bacterium]